MNWLRSFPYPAALRVRSIVLTATLLVSMAALCEACPTCKDGISDGANHANVIRGYFWSILFMMSMPFLIFGSLAFYFYRQVARARAAQVTRPAGIGQTYSNSGA